MDPLTADAVARQVGGALLAGDGGVVVRGVTTDSRGPLQGRLFVPLKGERFDGHDFIHQALDGGATACFIGPGRPVPESSRAAVIRVDDPLAALQRLATCQRARLAARVVAVTGSNGKTTTKDMIAAVASVRWRTVKSQGNYNNEIGLPLAVLAADRTTEVLVLEMGMRGVGQIRDLARIAKPHVGVVTNVGPVHLELLGTMEQVARAKAELVEELSGDGFAVLNADDRRVAAMARRTQATPVLYGTGTEAAVRATGIASRIDRGVEFILSWQGRSKPVMVPAPGRHNVHNALAAAAAALVLGMDLEEVAAGLLAFPDHASGMRLEVRERSDGVRVINDAYNASPASMRAALDFLAELPAKRKVAVLGDMLELGPAAAEAHRDVGRMCAAAGVAALVAVGRWAPTVAAEACKFGIPAGSVFACRDASEAGELAAGLVKPGDAVLVKASRGLRLEQVAERLLAAPE
ncbi:MAG: UDP-N-acetylmuramoyl-tripeptide--D-alanyl-D-alanine ligase [Firmicutes bacterium]|nr:UDP-N-acetylmuramoyl-tripeptide--D-alanyl-D-alanine ligase [Bacillota bacterium]